MMAMPNRDGHDYNDDDNEFSKTNAISAYPFILSQLNLLTEYEN